MCGAKVNMNSGRIYEVFIDNKSVKVGSTILSLARRRVKGYTKQFGPGVELRLIREISRPAEYSDSDFNFYLKACEAMDIARRKTYVDDGGLNKISPLIQALGHPMLEAEMGKLGSSLGGRLGGRKNVESGHIQALARKMVESGRLAEIRNSPRTKEAQRKAGRKAVESGQLARACTFEVRSKSGRKAVETGQLTKVRKKLSYEDRIRGGRKNVESGQLAKIRDKGRCQRWNINRGKPCVCSEHLIHPNS